MSCYPVGAVVFCVTSAYIKYLLNETFGEIRITGGEIDWEDFLGFAPIFPLVSCTEPEVVCFGDIPDNLTTSCNCLTELMFATWTPTPSTGVKSTTQSLQNISLALNMSSEVFVNAAGNSTTTTYFAGYEIHLHLWWYVWVGLFSGTFILAVLASVVGRVSTNGVRDYFLIISQLDLYFVGVVQTCTNSSSSCIWC